MLEAELRLRGLAALWVLHVLMRSEGEEEEEEMVEGGRAEVRWGGT